MLKFLWITSGGNPSGTPYSGIYGKFVTASVNWNVSTVAIANRNAQTEVLGLPGTGVFPDIPSERVVGAMGGLVTTSTGLLKLQEMYLFGCGWEGDGEGDYNDPRLVNPGPELRENRLTVVGGD